MNEKYIARTYDKTEVQRGASVNVVSKSDVFESWFAHHQFSARMSLKKMFAEPGSYFVISLVIGIALALPTSLLLLVGDIKTLSGHWDGNPQIIVYVRQTSLPAATLLLGDKLKHISGVKSVTYISPDAGLEEFKNYSGFGDALKLLNENPLPPVYVVSPTGYKTDELMSLSLQLRTLPEVDFVQMDVEWIKKLQQMMTIAERFVFIFGVLLCLGVLLSISNTIRLAIESRREEIVVVKLMGATDAFVRRPLLYTGLWFGLVGGLLACLLTVLTIDLLAEPAAQLALLYHSTFVLAGIGFPEALALLAFSALLGLAGAWLATARHLAQVQPR